MEIKQYDSVMLKDGRRAAIVEVLAPDVFIADVGSSPKDWETIDVTIDMIAYQVSDMNGNPYSKI